MYVLIKIKICMLWIKFKEDILIKLLLNLSYYNLNYLTYNVYTFQYFIQIVEKREKFLILTTLSYF